MGLLTCHLFLLLVLSSATGMVLCTRLVSAFTANFSLLFSLCIFNLLMVNLLEQVCFDFARIVATVMTAEILPIENIIRSITCILSQDVTELSAIRYYYVATHCFQLLKLHLFGREISWVLDEIFGPQIVMLNYTLHLLCTCFW